MSEGRRIDVLGTVQGVGFRPWIVRLARSSGVSGRVSNGAAGVTIDAFGESVDLDTFIERMTSEPPPIVRIERLTWSEIEPRSVVGFVIAPSTRHGARRASIPPDLATCADCLREIFDPSDRRYRYPFTNCTHCGPRFTIVREVPYDREATTMARFTMCAECKREYEDVFDRRFHAEPNACPSCGPKLDACDAYGRRFACCDPIALAVEALRDGEIVAIKGIGGFHLACDATNERVVRELRKRKRRDQKPFAVMVGNLQSARELCTVTEAARFLLESVEHPIVLMPRRASAIAESVAPDSARLGSMLPYTPLHHLLMQELALPLVMTSGNRSDEPIACDNADALERLSGVADLFLLHDREIESRCDDSVVTVMAGGPVPIRRARGFVPRSIELLRRIERPVLGCGALLKNTFCLAHGDAAHLGPHLGDLDRLEVYEDYLRAIDRMERFLGVKPELVAHDLHPGYPSTRYALERAGVTAIAVQHHHAHVAAAMAEHQLAGPVLGVAYDGTGFGTDGTSWGGEILLASYDRFTRWATFRPIALAGGDRAIAEPWRIAVALILDALGPHAPMESLAMMDGIGAHELEIVTRMIAQRVNTPLARGVGRYFDAVAALVLERTASAFEGQLATALEQCAGDVEAPPYSFAIEGELREIDLRPMMRELVGDVLAGRDRSYVAARFHETIARATAQVIASALEALGPHPVVLTGGCFQNGRLTESLLCALEGRAPVHVHRRVPPGDGGIALGQALVADAIARGER